MYSYSTDESVFGLMIAYFGVVVITGLLFYAISAFFLMKMFEKMGIESWKAWVPVFNYWVFLEAGGYPGWIILLNFASIIPFVGWLGSIAATVFLVMAAYRISVGFGKSGAWAVLFFFLSLVWMGILAFDSSKWRGLPDGARPGPTAAGAGVGVTPYSASGYQTPQQGGYQAPGQQPGGYAAPGQQPGGYAGPGQQPGGYQVPGQQPGGYAAPGQQAGGYQAPGQQSGGYAAPGQQPGGYQAPSQQSGGYAAPGQSTGGYQAPGQQPGGYAASGGQSGGYQASGQQFGGYQPPSQSESGYQAPGQSGDATKPGEESNDSKNPYAPKKPSGDETPDGSSN